MKKFYLCSHTGSIYYLEDGALMFLPINKRDSGYSFDEGNGVDLEMMCDEPLERNDHGFATFGELYESVMKYLNS